MELVDVLRDYLAKHDFKNDNPSVFGWSCLQKSLKLMCHCLIDLPITLGKGKIVYTGRSFYEGEFNERIYHGGRCYSFGAELVMVEKGGLDCLVEKDVFS
jgi:hypothetical protein